MVLVKAPRISKLDFFFSKKVGEAIAEYKMLSDGDKVLVGISGGKDSMSVLKVLDYKKGRLPIRFDIIACHVDMGLDDLRANILEDYFRQNGYEYTIERSRTWDSKRKKDGSLNCFWCAFNRRKRLFQVAKRLGCNKIVLGHHKDDIAETFLLNLFFHGEISTMLPKQKIFGGKLHFIRPLALCDEEFIIEYAKASGFPKFEDRCPNSDTSKRKLMKDLLKTASLHNKDVKTNIFNSMSNINYDYIIR